MANEEQSTFAYSLYVSLADSFKECTYDQASHTISSEMRVSSPQLGYDTSYAGTEGNLGDL